MAKKLHSILTDDLETCFLTGSMAWVERHHIFGGANHDNSAKYGMILPVQHYYHNEPPYGIEHNAKLKLAVKQYAQRKFEEAGHTREEFMLIFGKNYLYTEDDGYEINLRALGIPLPESA